MDIDPPQIGTTQTQPAEASNLQNQAGPSNRSSIARNSELHGMPSTSQPRHDQRSSVPDTSMYEQTIVAATLLRLPSSAVSLDPNYGEPESAHRRTWCRNLMERLARGAEDSGAPLLPTLGHFVRGLRGGSSLEPLALASSAASNAQQLELSINQDPGLSRSIANSNHQRISYGKRPNHTTSSVTAGGDPGLSSNDDKPTRAFPRGPYSSANPATHDLLPAHSPRTAPGGFKAVSLVPSPTVDLHSTEKSIVGTSQSMSGHEGPSSPIFTTRYRPRRNPINEVPDSEDDEEMQDAPRTQDQVSVTKPQSDLTSQGNSVQRPSIERVDPLRGHASAIGPRGAPVWMDDKHMTSPLDEHDGARESQRKVLPMKAPRSKSLVSAGTDGGGPRHSATQSGREDGELVAGRKRKRR